MRSPRAQEGQVVESAKRSGAPSIESGVELGPPPWRWLWVRRLVMASLLALGIGYLPYRFYVRSGLSRYLLLQGDLTQIRTENRRLRGENRRLREELESLAGDDRAIESVARNELGLIRPGEIVFKVTAAPDGSQR